MSLQYGMYDPYVDGRARDGIDGFDVIDPATNEPIATVAESGNEVVETAVSAGAVAIEEWNAYELSEKAKTLHRIAGRIRDDTDKLARLESAENGRPLSQSERMVEGAANYFEYYAGLVDKIEGETIPLPGDRLDYTLREPLGVTGHVVPWNASLLLGARSIAPALACGNTVVAKPSPEAPLSLLELGPLATEAGLPDGALNVVPGDGPRTGAALTNSDGVDGLVFTGSRQTGKQVMRAAADNVVPVGLELGGKSPNIVFPDANVERAADDTVNAFRNAGQVCHAGTRVFVHEDVYDRFLDMVVARSEAMNVGPAGEGADVGPLITREARQRVAGYVDDAVDDGARLLTGGTIPRPEGNFYSPTVLDQVDDDAPISCEEVFGPVVTVYEFSSEAEALRRANDTKYGLYAVVWTNDLTRAHRVARELDAGSVAINEYPATFTQAPFGGYKESGLGREKGQQAIHHYTQLKNVTIRLDE